MLLVRTDGIITLIDYQSKEFAGKIETFAGQHQNPNSKLTVEHYESLGVYLMRNHRKLVIFDDISLDALLTIDGIIIDAALGLDSTLLVLFGNNSILRRNISDDSVEETLSVPEGTLKSVKISPNGMFYVARAENPFSLNIWIDGNTQNLFTFNENESFSDVALSGDLRDLEAASKLSNTAICFDKTYLKLWNCDTGSFVQEYDYSRKTLKQLEVLFNGRLVVTNQEIGSKLRLLDLATKKDAQIFEGKDHLMIQKLSETSILISQTEQQNDAYVLNLI